jgi:mannose-1-phosphate guanylyltransferase
VTVGQGTTIERSVVLNGAEIGADCVLRDCIVAAGVRIGDGSEISGGAVLGEGVTVGGRNVLSRGVRVFPQTDLPEGAITF